MPAVLIMLMLCLLPTDSSAATNLSRPELDDLLELAIARGAEISPDGSHVAYWVFESDFEADADVMQLWRVATSGTEPLRMTRGEDAVTEFEWSADGRWIGFVRDDAVALINVAGGEPIELELDGVEGPSDLRFAPDGSSLFFLASPADDAWAEAREEAYGDYSVVREDAAFTHLWHQPLGSAMEAVGDPVPVTAGREFSVADYALSPDGGRIAFVARPTPDLVELLNATLYLVDAQGGTPEPLADEPGAKGSPMWRTDGERILYTAASGFPDYADIVLIDPDGGGRQVIAMPDHDADPVRFDGSGVLFEAGLRTRYGLFLLDPVTRRVSALSDSEQEHRLTTVSDDGRFRAWLSAADGGLREVMVQGPDGVRSLTKFNAQLEGIERPRQEVIRWMSFDGLEIEGVLTYPYGYDASRSWPLFVRTHGGPTGTDRPGLMGAPRSIYQPAVLAGRGGGAFVLQTNYRGSAGYGDAFQKTNLRQLGIGPARDIIAGVEGLVAEGKVDPDRVGCLGWSQGGHISAMLATYSTACTAAVMGAGISDWRTYYYNTDITQFTTEYFGATPLADDDVYALTSPVTYIDGASTPTLVQHGERDQRVPIANGYQLRQLLQDKGIEARMIVYAGMGHGPRSPRHRRAITEHALTWFDHYLYDAAPAEFVRPLPPPEDVAAARAQEHAGEN